MEKKKGSKKNLKITCMPPLISILLKSEMDKGLPLTEQEVLEIADNANAVALPLDERRAGPLNVK